LTIGAIRWILSKNWFVAEIPASKICSKLPMLMPCSKRYAEILPQRIRDAKLLAAQLLTNIPVRNDERSAKDQIDKYKSRQSLSIPSMGQ
jgi:hypothetical protein